MDTFIEALDNIILMEKLKCGLNYQHLVLLTKFYNKLTIIVE